MAASFIAFVVAALTIILLIFGLAFAVGSAQEGLITYLKTGAPVVKRWGAYILIIIGVWFIILAVFAGYFASIFPV